MKDIRGVRFLIDQRNLYNLKNILTPLLSERLVWLNSLNDNETYIYETNDEVFDDLLLTSDEIKERIDQQCQVIFLKLIAFESVDDVSEIRNYTEFTEKNCLIAVLIEDCEYVSIYFKNRELCERYYSYCIDMKYLGLQFIDKSDDRTGFVLR